MAEETATAKTIEDIATLPNGTLVTLAKHGSTEVVQAIVIRADSDGPTRLAVAERDEGSRSSTYRFRMRDGGALLYYGEYDVITCRFPTQSRDIVEAKPRSFGSVLGAIDKVISVLKRDDVQELIKKFYQSCSKIFHNIKDYFSRNSRDAVVSAGLQDAVEVTIPQRLLQKKRVVSPERQRLLDTLDSGDFLLLAYGEEKSFTDCGIIFKDDSLLHPCIWKLHNESAGNFRDIDSGRFGEGPMLVPINFFVSVAPVSLLAVRQLREEHREVVSTVMVLLRDEIREGTLGCKDMACQSLDLVTRIYTEADLLADDDFTLDAFIRETRHSAINNFLEPRKNA